MSNFSFSEAKLSSFAQQVLEKAQQQGATACDVNVSESTGQNVAVRLGEVETIEYTHDKGVGITVYLGQRKGHASTSDFSLESLEKTIAAALTIARYAAVDEFAGLPDKDELATDLSDLDLYHPWVLPVEEAISLARACEAAGQAVDPRICNSEGAAIYTNTSCFVYANSMGFIGHGLASCHSMVATLIAEGAEGMQRDYWYTCARDAQEMDAPQIVGRIAGERVVRRLGARRVATGTYPVLFDATVASSLIGNWVSAVSGGNLYRKTSFLVDSLGTAVFSPCVNILENPFIKKGLASSRFDAEGVKTRQRQMIRDGIQEGYFLSSYSARKLGMKTSGNAGGAHNLMVMPTDTLPALLKKLDTGVLVTELMGHGIDTVTGNYSRGAAGFWVENGVIAYPIEAFTVAGNLRDIFKGIVGIGSDIRFSSSRLVGSILVDNMAIAGD